jgi:hypothetical protein
MSAVGFSPETGRRDRAPVRRTIPATAPTKAKPPAKAAAAAVIAAAQFWEQVKKASVVGYFRLQRPAEACRKSTIWLSITESVPTR